jgi:hypothetical protein
MTQEEIIKRQEMENQLRKDLGLPSLEEQHEQLKQIQEDKKLNPEIYSKIPVRLPILTKRGLKK